MSNAAFRAMAVHWQGLKALHGASAILSRGELSDEATVVPAETQFEQLTEDSHTIRQRVRDYLISRSDFERIIGAGEVPERGDKITEIVADYSRSFEAIELGGEVYRWFDKSGQVLRIHTIETCKETTTTEEATTTTGGD